MNNAVDEVDTVESPIRLRHSTKHLLHSIVLLQIAIAANVLSIIIFNLIRRVAIYFPVSDSLLRMLNISLFIHLFTLIIPYFLILVCLRRIISLLKAEVHIFFSISAIVLFLFYFYLKVLDLWHFILINTGRGYSESDWPVIGLLILPPLGIISCYVIGIRLNLRFSAFMNQRKIIQWLIYSFAVIWLLRIAFAYVLWLQNSQTIEFSLRYLVFYSRRWQIESVFYWRFFRYLPITLLLWQIWLFFLLRCIKIKCRYFLIEK
ncbi:MAG: hypothetical protein ACYTEU_06415 [Planctomycetota bacterium]|jgi:hypothetical protein